jgi:hypothetical protein
MALGAAGVEVSKGNPCLVTPEISQRRPIAASSP